AGGAARVGAVRRGRHEARLHHAVQLDAGGAVVGAEAVAGAVDAGEASRPVRGEERRPRRAVGERVAQDVAHRLRARLVEPPVPLLHADGRKLRAHRGKLALDIERRRVGDGDHGTW
ncbi:MAG: hypothetical protein ACK56I_08400, partial [bacterium]